MKELAAITGIYNALKQIQTRNGYLTNAGNRVSFLTDYYQDGDDLPLIVVTPDGLDETAQIGHIDQAEFRISSSLIVEAHSETTAGDLTAIYNLWHDIVTAVMAWRPTIVSEAVQVEYRGKTITLPSETTGSIAVVQLRFGVIYTDSFIISN